MTWDGDEYSAPLNPDRNQPARIDTAVGYQSAPVPKVPDLPN